MRHFYQLLIFSILTAIAAGGCEAIPRLSKPTQTPAPGVTLALTPTRPQPTQPPEPTEQAIMPGSNWVSPLDSMEMVYIPAGEFTMGWRGIDATIANGPGPTADFLEFTASVDEFWIDKLEVTNAQYRMCVQAGDCRPGQQNNIPPQGVEYFTSREYDNYPVVNVSWYQARDYCTWAGRRMPTEAEWEKAARGTDGRKYVWGNEPYDEEFANICDKDCPPSVRGAIANPKFDDGYPGPAPVGSYPRGASPYGVLDMAGNVWEWTSTAEAVYPYDPNDGRESQYDIEDGSKWPERILRGGPWNGGYAYVRASYRYRAVAIYWNKNMGIRCAWSQ